MRQFYTYISRFIKEDFNPWYYSTVAVFIALSIWLNYSIDLEDSILDKLPNTFQRFIAFTGLYVVAYLIVIIVNHLYYPENKFLTNKKLWIIVVFGFSVLSFDTAIHTYSYFTLPIEIYFYVIKVFNNLFTIVTYVLPLALFYLIYDREKSFYGLTTRGFQFKPYLELFLLVVPIVIIASFHENFNSYYPLYKQNAAAGYWGISEWVTASIYELAYGWSFVSVELIFRGVFVVGMIKILGRHAILPMVVVYCFIHFGKPVGECISSVFGGFILGVIAYYSRNILGGIIIHIGLAWTMEITAAFHQ